MLENLEFGEAESVAPAKLSRKKEPLPPAIAAAWGSTPIGEARTLFVKVSDPGNRLKIGNALLRLLRARAKEQGLVAFKAAATPNDHGLSLYWQKKPGRVTPAVLPMPSEPVTAKPRKRE